MTTTSKEYQLIMLPTENESNLVLREVRPELYYHDETIRVRESSGYNNQHLYIIDTKAEIKIKDCVIEWQQKDCPELQYINSEYVIAKEIQKKIIASSDKKLFPSSWIDISKSQWIIDSFNKTGKMPEQFHIQTGFNGQLIIEPKEVSNKKAFEYIAANTFVESKQTEKSWDDIFMIIRDSDVSIGTKEAMIREKYYSPINKNVVQEKMYSKDEVITLLAEYRLVAWKDGVTAKDLEKFIKDNLK